MRRLLACALALACVPSALARTPAPPSVIELLEGYRLGRFQAVVSALRETVSFDDFLRDILRDADAWIAAAGERERTRREIIAATVALEAARVGADREWKLTQQQPKMCAGDECYEPLNVVYWKAPPRLIEWGCVQLRRHDPPLPVERWWQLAALAVAQYAEDPQFLVGDPKIGLGRGAGEIGNRGAEITHLDHARARFPGEPRFALAQVIAYESGYPAQAAAGYAALAGDADIGGEALMRLGAFRLRQRRPELALKALEQAVPATRDPYVAYLIQFFMGQAFEQLRDPARAEAAYRTAARTVPHAQSASIAWAGLAFRDGRRAEGQRIIADMLAASPPPDPWHEFAHADDRFWPALVARLRAEILR